MDAPRKKYTKIRWRVDKTNHLYVYNEDDLLFTVAEVFEPDDDSVSEIIDEKLGNDCWSYAFEHQEDDDSDDDDDDDSDDSIDADDDVDTALGDGDNGDLGLSDGRE